MHMAQLMPLPLTVSCSSKIQIGFTFLVPAYPGCPGKEAIKWLRECCESVDAAGGKLGQRRLRSTAAGAVGEPGRSGRTLENASHAGRHARSPGPRRHADAHRRRYILQTRFDPSFFGFSSGRSSDVTRVLGP